MSHIPPPLKNSKFAPHTLPANVRKKKTYANCDSSFLLIFIIFLICSAHFAKIFNIQNICNSKIFWNLYNCINHQNWIREAAKKLLFLVARPLRPLAPLLGLVALGTFFLTSKKFFFSLVAHPFSPTSLSGTATKQRTFFCGSPYYCFILFSYLT